MCLHGSLPLFSVLQGSFCYPTLPRTFPPQPRVNSTGDLSFLCIVHRLDIFVFLNWKWWFGESALAPLSCGLWPPGVEGRDILFLPFLHLIFSASQLRLQRSGSLSRRPGHCSRQHRTCLSSEVVRMEPEQGNPAGIFFCGLLVSPLVTQRVLCCRGTELASKVWVVAGFFVCVHNNASWS